RRICNKIEAAPALIQLLRTRNDCLETQALDKGQTMFIDISHCNALYALRFQGQCEQQPDRPCTEDERIFGSACASLQFRRTKSVENTGKRFRKGCYIIW